MNTIKRRNLQFSALAVAVLAILTIATVLTVTSTVGPAQAQRGGPTPTPPPAPIPIPGLCGPGEDHFPEKPDEVVSEGHYALFDAYWLETTSVDGDANAPRNGTLNDNLCPPSAAHKDVTTGGKTEEVTTRFKANIDVRTTIIQVNGDHKADVVATDAEAGTDKLSLKKYEGVRKGLGLAKGAPVPAGTKVWWLRLEDTARDLPPSDLVLGFSTGLLDGNYWDNPEGPTFEYELESVRVLGANPADRPHVFTYWEPDLESGLVWDGIDMDTNSMPMEAGEYEHLEWVFTKPGTYILQVHLKGHVRQTKPDGWDDAGPEGKWEKLTEDKTVTSEVKRYVFQVGDLRLNAQPYSGYHRTVTGGATADTHVGDPIPVYGVDSDALKLTLHGEGKEDFKVRQIRGTYVGAAAQLVVAPGAELRYAERPYYDLQLRVTDGHDHEDNEDDVIDDVAAVRITVLPESGPWVSVTLDNEHPHFGESVKLSAQIHGLGEYDIVEAIDLYGKDGANPGVLLQTVELPRSYRHEFTIRHDHAHQWAYAVSVRHLNGRTLVKSKTDSALIPLVWRPASE